MTIFEYIKNEATIEQIAQIFDNLENDSGYYTENNIEAISNVIIDPKKYLEQRQQDSKYYYENEDDWEIYNDHAYKKTIDFLNNDINDIIK